MNNLTYYYDEIIKRGTLRHKDKNGIFFKEAHFLDMAELGEVFRKDTGIYKCSILHEQELAWLLKEHKEPVLDDVEKAYLKSFIRPFKHKILLITKERSYLHEEKECLWFSLKTTGDSFYLPKFKKGTMYKGMTSGKSYTLEELGL